MQMNDQDYKFDEDEALKFIRAELSEDVNLKYDDEEILCIIDIIWDYYESNGFLSLNLDETEEEVLDIDNLMKYVKKEVKADDDLNIDSKDVEKIVKAELDYEESLEDFI
jgi:hypothetical protein